MSRSPSKTTANNDPFTSSLENPYNVVDSSGWIECFMGSTQTAFFEAAISALPRLIVPSVSIYEVHKRLSTLKNTELTALAIATMRRGRVIDITADRAVAASNVAQTHKLAMADAIMYSVALEFKATFWTQDVDYLGLPNVQYHSKLAK
jgi:predicted nucleic acid-binding protein